MSPLARHYFYRPFLATLLTQLTALDGQKITPEEHVVIRPILERLIECKPNDQKRQLNVYSLHLARSFGVSDRIFSRLTSRRSSFTPISPSDSISFRDPSLSPSSPPPLSSSSFSFPPSSSLSSSSSSSSLLPPLPLHHLLHSLLPFLPNRKKLPIRMKSGALLFPGLMGVILCLRELFWSARDLLREEKMK